MYQFPDAEQQWMYMKLLEIAGASEEERKPLIQELASQPEKYLDMLIDFTGTFMKTVRKPAIWVIQAIGYPGNAKAIYNLIEHFDDVNSPARDDAGYALLDLGPTILIPHLLHYFWIMEQKPWGWEHIEHVCRWFRFPDASRDDLVGLGPYLAYLIVQGDQPNYHELEPDEPLMVLEKIGGECASYALPALLHLVRDDKQSGVAEQAWRLIRSFGEEQLAPYNLILQDLEKQREEKQ